MNRSHVRKYPRVRIRFSVLCCLGEKEFRCPASMVGGGGIFVETPDLLPVDTEVALRFRPAKHLPLFQATGRVCYHVEGQGMALEFAAISPEQRGLLLHWIHHRIGNKRQYPRVRLATQVRCEDSMILAFSRDVSQGGMFVETRDPMDPGSRLSLRFNLDGNSPTVVASGVVTYQVEKMGMGVQFIDMSPQDRQRIKDFVAAALTPPAKKRPRTSR